MKKSTGQKTREKIMKTACQIWPDVTISNVSRSSGISYHNIIYYYPNTEELKNACAEWAVKKRISHIITQLIAMKHPAVAKMSSGERIAHFLKS